MRERRDANRRRLKGGLIRDESPTPIACHSQGSYAMHTMVQQTDKDYDIDDGGYFTKESLQGPRGGDKSASDAKEMVRKALHTDSFKKPPDVLKNCVRVYYDAGYHVDVPVYRKFVRTNAQGEEVVVYELASSDWKRSDPRAVTSWFLNENKRQSPDQENGGQLRRVTRLLKAFARSRDSWKGRIATGFMITKLVTEKYVAHPNREDKTLYDTMVAIRDRLNHDLEIAHPTVEGEYLTKGTDDARARIFGEKLDEAIDKLAVLFDSCCSRERALKAWDQVFNTAFFRNRIESDEERDKSVANKAAAARSGSTSATILIDRSKERAAQAAVDKRGGGRYA
jgi:hypothetical protein